MDFAIAFILRSGVGLIREHLRDLLKRGGRVRIVTGDYLDATDPDALVELLDLDGDLTLRVFEAASSTFHPKAYIFHYEHGEGLAIVGSSNLTRPALAGGVEWNYRVLREETDRGFADVAAAFEELLVHPRTRDVDAAWIDTYRQRRDAARRRELPEVTDEPPAAPPEPHEIQREALEALRVTRASGNEAGLVVLATGLGKTWLAEFDSSHPSYRRILFVAHREEILDQAMQTFRRIRPQACLGRYTGTERSPDADVLFASIQTLGRNHHLDRFAPGTFDYIVVDEFHHAAAPTYRRLIAHFTPQFLLGLTATPERMDGGDLLGLCQENLVYRRDMIDGIEAKLLCPFRYYGVPDDVDYANIPWRSARFDEEELTRAVATNRRAENALDQYRKWDGSRTLGFCCSQRHADFMAEYFERSGVPSLAVHSGDTSAPRATALEALRAGRIKTLFAVDMFNEGLDVPDIDTVLMLSALDSDTALCKLIEQNPIDAWCGGKGTGGKAYFSYDGSILKSHIPVPPDSRDALQTLVRELVDWRMADYLDRDPVVSTDRFVCKVLHSGGRPIIKLPARTNNPDIPHGPTPIEVNGTQHQATFAKEFINVINPDAQSKQNILTEILRAWFGQDAGKPGTRFQVVIERVDGEWKMEPVRKSANPATARSWHRTMREKIPSLFGLDFNIGSWNQGFVKSPDQLFLLVTLEKTGLNRDHQYDDQFVSTDLFSWQSQNRAKQDNADGQLICSHRQRGVEVHLFVRPHKLEAGKAAPFLYCGLVDFDNWQGNSPITVTWRLREPVPDEYRSILNVPPSQL